MTRAVTSSGDSDGTVVYLYDDVAASVPARRIIEAGTGEVALLTSW